MRSVLAAPPLSLGAPVLRNESVERGGSLCDGEPKQRPLERVKPWLGIRPAPDKTWWLQGSPYPQSCG